MSTLQQTKTTDGADVGAERSARFERLRGWLRRPDVRAALVATLGLRLFTSGVMALIAYLLHDTYASLSIQANTIGQSQGLTIVPTSLRGAAQFLTTPWVRWDADVYLKIAEHGYSWYGSTAFLPFYPLLVRVGGTALGGHFILASLVISTITSFVMFLLLYRLTLRLTGSGPIARYTLAVGCLLPIAFFFMAPYTESLFLALAFATVLASLDGKWGRASLYAAVASVTRQQGVLLGLLAAPALWGAARDWWRERERDHERFRALVRTGGGPALLVIASVGAYALWIVYLTRIASAPAPWQVLTSSHGWRQHFEFPGAGVVNDMVTIVQNPGLVLAHKLSLPLDVCAAIFGGVGLWLGRKRLPAGLLLFLAACWCVALVKLEPTGWTNSAARYLLTLLPVCIVPASWLHRARPGWRVAYFGIFAVLSCVFMGEWVLWSWVS